MSESESPYLHPEASGWLQALQCPEFLESLSYKQLEQSLMHDGYVQENAGEVTIGWGRKVSGSSTNFNTSVYLKLADGRLVILGLGGKGAYTLATLINDCSNPTEAEKYATQLNRTSSFGRQTGCSAQTNTFLQTFDSMETKEPESLLQDERTAFLSTIRKRLGF